MYQKSWWYAILFLRYMVHDGCNCSFSFWTIFCPFTALTSREIKIWIKKKTPGGIIILHKCTKNYNLMMYGSWDMVHDRGTDGKSDIYRWVPLLKKSIFRTVCNSLWDEKKKKRIVKQVLLSKLWYIV